MGVFARSVTAWLVVPVFMALAVTPAVAQTSTGPLVLSGQLINLNNQINLPGQTPVVITIDRWSTAGEREQLLTVLRERGRDGLLEMMQSVRRVGAIRIPGSLNYDFHFALRGEAPGGMAVTLIADRPVGFTEAVEGPRTLDYRFMVIQVQLNSIGQGGGRLSMVTKVEVDAVTGEINLETWEDLFVTLRSLRRTSGR
jgi:hypothetical protein